MKRLFVVAAAVLATLAVCGMLGAAGLEWVAAIVAAAVVGFVVARLTRPKVTVRP